LARCQVDTGSGWTDAGFAEDEGGPLFHPALVVGGSLVWAAWADNPHGTTDLRGDTVGLSLASWSRDSAWSEATVSTGHFPTDPALVATPAGLVAAFGTSLGNPDYRYTRRVRVVPFQVAGPTAVAQATTDFARDQARIELPALSASGNTVYLAMIAIEVGAVDVEASTSKDGGTTWTEVTRLPSEGRALPHLAPAWDGGQIVWAAWGERESELCRATPGAVTAECVNVGSARIQSFAVHAGTATVIRDGRVAAWEAAEVAW
jgi:hypothetical protein